MTEYILPENCQLDENYRIYRRGRNGRKIFYDIRECVDCKKEFLINLSGVRHKIGLCRSCTCGRGGAGNKTHGMNTGNSRLYTTWQNMKRRCINPTEKEKRNYGSKVTICDDWLEFLPFRKWAMSNGYTSKLTIDRKDGDKGYNPDNCRFVDYSTQSANRRITDANKSGYVGVSRRRDGKWRSIVQWKKKQISVGTFFSKKSAAMARDKYVIINNLPHLLNFPQFRTKYRLLAKQLEKDNGP